MVEHTFTGIGIQIRQITRLSERLINNDRWTSGNLIITIISWIRRDGALLTKYCRKQLPSFPVLTIPSPANLMQVRVLCYQNDVKSRQESQSSVTSDNKSCLIRLTIVVILALSWQKNKNSCITSRKKDGQDYKKNRIQTSIHSWEIELCEVIRAIYISY